MTDEQIAHLTVNNLALRSQQSQVNQRLQTTMQQLSVLVDSSSRLPLERQLMFVNELLAAVNRETKIFVKQLLAIHLTMKGDLDEENIPGTDRQKL